jgi:cobalt-zinc-cadmium efflux system protein
MVMGADHSHVHGAPRDGHIGALWWALALTSLFLVAEIVGAFLTRSLALLSDAAHMLTDVAALAISIAAIYIAKRAADRKRTFGYQRFEVLAAAFNATLLFAAAVYILYEAYRRLRSPEPIQSTGMFVIACIGLVVNLLSMRLLKSGSEESLNVKGAYLEVWSDMLGSVGVIVAAVVIRYTSWLWMDSLIAAGIGLWVLPRTWTLLNESLNVLLQGVPKGIDLDSVEVALKRIDGVEAIHDLHVWSLTSGKNVLSVHVVCDPAQRAEQAVLADVDSAARSFGIGHTTVQVEASGFHATSENTHRESSAAEP